MFIIPRMFKSALLLVVGFALGLLGVTVVKGGNAVLSATLMQQDYEQLALNACVDTEALDDDIFFLSCGGIY